MVGKDNVLLRSSGSTNVDCETLLDDGMTSAAGCVGPAIVPGAALLPKKAEATSSFIRACPPLRTDALLDDRMASTAALIG